MKIAHVLQSTVRQLKDGGVDDALMESQYLVAAAADIPRARLPLSRERNLKREEASTLQRWIAQRSAGKPLAYLVGEQPFMDLSLRVNPDVLIPRPETEELVERVQARLNGMPQTTVADIGTGSGNIALCLARQPQVARVYAVDLSENALRVAADNERRNPGRVSVQWRWGDLLDPLRKESIRPHVIVANLPYVSSDEMPLLPREVRCEPSMALHGGRHGMELIDRIIKEAPAVLLPGGSLFLEMGADQKALVQASFQSSKGWKTVRVFNDLAGRPRMVEARREN